jgi:hypothetical protein
LTTIINKIRFKQRNKGSFKDIPHLEKTRSGFTLASSIEFKFLLAALKISSVPKN